MEASAVQQMFADNLTEGKAAVLTEALDDLRRLGELDLELNQTAK